MAAEPTLSTLAALAASASGSATPSNDVMNTSDTQRTKEQLRRHYIRALHKVIDESDTIILVLDARDPEGCRSRLVEEEVRRRESEGKKLVFVLNKIGTNTMMIYTELTCLIFSPHLSSVRPCTKRQCASMAPISPPHDTNTSIPQCLKCSTLKPLLQYRSCSRSPSEGIPSQCCTKCDCWRGRIS